MTLPLKDDLKVIQRFVWLLLESQPLYLNEHWNRWDRILDCWTLQKGLKVALIIRLTTYQGIAYCDADIAGGCIFVLILERRNINRRDIHLPHIVVHPAVKLSIKCCFLVLKLYWCHYRYSNFIISWNVRCPHLPSSLLK